MGSSKALAFRRVTAAGANAPTVIAAGSRRVPVQMGDTVKSFATGRDGQVIAMTADHCVFATPSGEEEAASWGDVCLPYVGPPESPPRPGSIADALQRIHAAGGDAWDHITEWKTPTPDNPFARVRRMALDLEATFDELPRFDDVARGRAMEQIRSIISHLQDGADQWDRNPATLTEEAA